MPSIFASVRDERAKQDIVNFQQFLQQRQAAERAPLPGELEKLFLGPGPITPPIFRPQSRTGINLFSDFLLQEQQIRGRPVTPPSGFQLSPGQTRFDASGRPIAQVPAAPITPISGSFQQITDPATGRQINALVNPRTGNIIKKFGAVEEGLSTKDKAQIAVTQAREFRTDQRIKNLQIIERSERGMQAALKAATSPNVKSRIASDQALGVLFQKMLDPESVVRESEFARTPQGASAINQLLAIAPKLRLGGLKLLDEDRQALVDMAQLLLDGAKISANQAFDEFSLRADELGLNKKIVFGGAKRFDIAKQPRTPITPPILNIDQRIAELEAKARQ